MKKGNKSVAMGKQRTDRFILIAVALVLGIIPASASMESLIYDPQTRKWVPYTKKRAISYYRVNGGSPEV